MKKQVLYDDYIKDKKFERIMAQEDLIMEVTEGFCEMLEEKKIKKADLAKLMGKTKGYISQLLNGGRNMTLRSLSDIAYHLGCIVNISIVKRSKKVTYDSLDITTVTKADSYDDSPYDQEIRMTYSIDDTTTNIWDEGAQPHLLASAI